MTDEILKLADDCCKDTNFGTWEFGGSELKAFYRAAYNKAIEDAAKACSESDRYRGDYFAGVVQVLEMK